MSEQSGAPTPGPRPSGGVTDVDEALPTSNHRYGAFTDAVVAIALTLLILPLMDSAISAPGPITGLGFVLRHSAELRSFGISFCMIAMFWVLHHRAFREDTPYSVPLALANFAWMITIVFLPVATSIQAVAPGDNRSAIAIYDGTLVAAAWLMTLLTELQRRARAKAGMLTPNISILATPLALAILFTVVFVIGVLFPQFSYIPLFIMFFTALIRRALIVLGLREPAYHNPDAPPAEAE